MLLSWSGHCTWEHRCWCCCWWCCCRWWLVADCHWTWTCVAYQPALVLGYRCGYCSLNPHLLDSACGIANWFLPCWLPPEHEPTRIRPSRMWDPCSWILRNNADWQPALGWIDCSAWSGSVLVHRRLCRIWLPPGRRGSCQQPLNFQELSSVCRALGFSDEWQDYQFPVPIMKMLLPLVRLVMTLLLHSLLMLLLLMMLFPLLSAILMPVESCGILWSS